MATPYVIDSRPANDPSMANTNGPIETWGKLQEYFGVVHDTSKGEDAVAEGQYYWALVGILLRTGPAAYIVNVETAPGVAAPKILVFRHWPGADPLPFTPDPDYFRNAVAGFTGPNGDIGLGYSGDSVVIDGKGPDSIWISADPAGAGVNRRRASDAIHNLGWLGGTDHLTPQPIFRAVMRGVTPPPATGDYRLDVIVANELVGYIPVIAPDQPPATGADYMRLIGPDGADLGTVSIKK